MQFAKLHTNQLLGIDRLEYDLDTLEIHEQNVGFSVVECGKSYDGFDVEDYPYERFSTKTIWLGEYEVLADDYSPEHEDGIMLIRHVEKRDIFAVLEFGLHHPANVITAMIK